MLGAMSSPGRLPRSLSIGFLVALGIAMAAALVTSKLYWGYFFTRPGLNARISSAPRYLSLTSFRSLPELDPAATTLAVGSPPEELLRLLREETYDFYHLNVLEHLERRGVLRALKPMSAESLAALLPVLTGSGVLEQPDPGYARRQYLNGVVLEAEEGDGTLLLYVGAHGAEVSNDHYPSYQLLFEGEPSGRWRLVERTRYFHDVAGIEGLEWPFLFVAYAFPCVGLWGALVAVVLFIRSRQAPTTLIRP